MRALILASAIAASIVATMPAKAADGCSYDAYGRLYCLPGAQPAVPYGYYGNGYDGYEPRYQYGYREYDPGAAIALGAIGTIAGVMAYQAYHHRRAYRHR